MFNFKVLIVLATCLSWSSCKLDNYCSICADHTLCKYHDVGEDCVDVGEGGVSEEEKKVIVDTHNWLRKIVAGGFEPRGKPGPQPKAANMRKFEWDDELAKVAQRWSDQCLFEHDTCRNVKRWKVGQNIFWKMRYPTHHVNWTEAIISWYDEVALFDSKDVQTYSFDSSTGHFTQMMWHDTYAVGCGRRDYGYNKLYVCNYGPTGNWIGEPVYTIGEPCSKCPRGTYCDEYLCGTGSSKKNESVVTVRDSLKSADDVVETLTPPKENAKDVYATQNKTLDLESQEKKTTLGAEKEVHIATTNSIEDDDCDLDEDIKKGLGKIYSDIKKLMKNLVKRVKAKTTL